MKKILLLTILALALALAATATAQTDFRCTPDWFCPDVDGSTTIRYALLEASTVSLEIVDSFSGQRIRSLIESAIQPAGYHEIYWDGRDDQGAVLDVQPFEVLLHIEGGQTVETHGALYCDDDLGTPVRETAGAKDVTLGFWVALSEAPDVELAIYTADGITLVDELYSGGLHQLLGIIWPPNEAPDGPLPAGDYLCRLTSSVYSEDLLFPLDPVQPAGMTVFVSDGDGNLVEGLDPGPDSAQVYGPLQEAWIQFDRRLSAPELEYLLGGGLRIRGVLETAGPGPMAVTPDSSTIHIEAFAPLRPWNELLGDGWINNIGMLTPDSRAFRVGYHQTGFTALSAECVSLGVTDPDDWQVDDPYHFDAPCPNPVAPGQSTSLGLGFWDDTFVGVILFDESGRIVRRLAQDWMNGGYYTLVWDLTDEEGAAVPDGMYHLVWHRPDDETGEMVLVTSGEIYVWSQVAVEDERPVAASTPRLLPNHPNPFNPRTTIAFELPEAQAVRLRVFDLAGSLVSVLIDGEIREAGRHAAVWNGRDDRGRPLASGTYLYRLEAANSSETRSMVLLK